MKHYENFIRWRENIRWKYHFAKDKDPMEPEPDFKKEPWYQRTSRPAPIARDCPELEAMLAGVERDLFDPDLRKKIKDNLTQEQREFIGEVKNEFPIRDLRVRFEDKGHRFVIADGHTEDEQIEADLQNEEFYRVLDNDPTENDKQNVQSWADRGLERGEISESQHKFVTSLKEYHPAVPKPLYKTTKSRMA